MAKKKSLREILAGNVQRLREESGKNKNQLCRSIRMSRAFWDKIEAGKADPSNSTVERIAEAFGIEDALELLREPAPTKKTA